GPKAAFKGNLRSVPEMGGGWSGLERPLADFQCRGRKTGKTGFWGVQPGSNPLHHRHLYPVACSRHPPASRYLPFPFDAQKAKPMLEAGESHGRVTSQSWDTPGSASTLRRTS